MSSDFSIPDALFFSSSILLFSIVSFSLLYQKDHKLNSNRYTFISGSGITNKKSGEQYARKLESALIGVNMSTELTAIEVKGAYGDAVKIAIYVTTCVIILACVVVGYIHTFLIRLHLSFPP